MIQVLIIEDEKKSALEMKRLVEALDKNIFVCGMLTSVTDTIEWLSKNGMPHLIIADIQLTDGLSFEIFETIDTTVPVIFCTAYDQYALQAFEANGISYLLKLIDQEKLQKVFYRLKLLSNFFIETSLQHNARLRNMLSYFKKYKRAVLVYNGPRIIPVQVKDICYLHSKNTAIAVKTPHNEFEIKQHLNVFAEELDPNEFYRANRQYVIQRSWIDKVVQIEGRKLEAFLLVPVPERIIISKEKSSDFLRWIRTSLH